MLRDSGEGRVLNQPWSFRTKIRRITCDIGYMSELYVKKDAVN